MCRRKRNPRIEIGTLTYIFRLAPISSSRIFNYVFFSGICVCGGFLVVLVVVCLCIWLSSLLHSFIAFIDRNWLCVCVRACMYVCMSLELCERIRATVVLSSPTSQKKISKRFVVCEFVTPINKKKGLNVCVCIKIRTCLSLY